MLIRQADLNDRETLTDLVHKFRIEIARFRSSPSESSLIKSESEVGFYFERKYPIFLAQDSKGEILGYVVCKVQDDIVWAEQMYVLPDSRRKGIGSKLYECVEKLASEVGSNTPYNWVHCNNAAIIRFLKRRGYTVLNLLELRKPRPGESTDRKIKVGSEEFAY